ncbi:hypothetical protein [Aeromicrobium sp. Leaf291]|uniref:hypothetical protein n=1 Tax=Aeromicrobium sp. Leaf291 TaxID=1736325 RepID=UPI0006FF8255|nr:hypothetical protein [Aeromicrobium sp. Leaf291]KQP81584.1 hypothetical protein ASF35_16265 [Aeromicrobium sp. Leaf291]
MSTDAPEQRYVTPPLPADFINDWLASSHGLPADHRPHVEATAGGDVIVTGTELVVARLVERAVWALQLGEEEAAQAPALINGSRRLLAAIPRREVRRLMRELHGDFE